MQLSHSEQWCEWLGLYISHVLQNLGFWGFTSASEEYSSGTPPDSEKMKRLGITPGSEKVILSAKIIEATQRYMVMQGNAGVRCAQR